MTLTTCFLAALFWIFFNTSKHDPMLANVGVFIEDPFDAVGSFGIQLVTLAALLSLIRVFRPHAWDAISNDRIVLILRGNALSFASVAVTLAADGVVMLRYLSQWTGAPTGWVLAALVTGLLALTALLGWWVFRLGWSLNLFDRARLLWITLAVFMAAGLFLAFYPDAWRAGVVGGVFAALSGMVLLFLVTFAIVKAIFPRFLEPSEDLLDDLGAVYIWIRTRTRFAGFLFCGIEAIASNPWFRTIMHWLNPREHHWNLMLLAALGTGLLLIRMESLSEGAPNLAVILLVFGIYVGIEGAGVLLGYVLFNRYLGIFR
jgi:hypothetical protein